MILIRTAMVAVALAVVAADASAQRRGGRGRSVDVDAVLIPSLAPSDFESVVRLIDLDVGSLLILETVFDDYAVQFAELSQSIRIRLQDARPVAGGTVGSQRRGAEAMQQQIEELRRQLSRDIRNAGSSEERTRIREQYAKQMEELSKQQQAVEEITGTADRWGEFLLEQSTILRDWVQQRSQLEDELEEGVLAVLKEDQIDSWRLARAEIRRRIQTQRGRLEGERMDLIALLDQQVPPGELRTALQPTVESYAIRLDAALAARERFELEAAPVVSEVLRAGNWDRMRAIVEQEAVVRTGVRDVNLAVFDALLESLPEPSRSGLAAEVHRTFNATVWGKGRFDRALDAALEREDLTDSERTSLEALRVQCAPGIDAIRQRQDAALRSQGPARWTFEQLRLWSGAFPGVRFDETIDSGGITDLTGERQEVELACTQQIKPILGDERYAELPGAARPSGRRGREGSDRRSEAERRRQELYKEFDSDGDGRLNSDERRVMRDELLRRQREGKSSP
ncbi:MAG: hypothetical protein CMJ41_03555 [Phycisphaerae bacterium]|nr:hypothetical protein [Phycisphaerae bacterium]